MIFAQKDYSISVEGEKITLLRKEFFLLSFLYKNKGCVFSREELLHAVWPMEEPTDRTVDDHIYRLRKKLRPFRDRIMIKTVKGYGYLLELKETRPLKNVPMPAELSQPLVLV